MNRKQKVFFLDRDGVINVDRGYVFRIEEFEFIQGIFEVLKTLRQEGYPLIVITNQSGIGRGYYTEGDFNKLNEWMINRLAEQNIEIAAVYRCPHAPEEMCSCRKPAPGMFLQAIREHHIDPACSWMIGDKDSDLAAAKAAGIPNRVLFGSEESSCCTHRISTLSDLLLLPLKGNG